MNIQVAVLCDAATDDNWKLNLSGGVRHHIRSAMPAVHMQCTVALRVTFMPTDEGTRNLSLNFINADGHPLMAPIPLQVDVTLPDDVHFLTRNFIVHLERLQFNEPGLYSVEVRMDNQPQASIPLLVKLIPRPAQ